MIESFLTKIAGHWAAVTLKWAAVLLVCASPFVYHSYLTSNLEESRQEVKTLSEKTLVLEQIIKNHEIRIGFLVEQQEFLVKLEQDSQEKDKEDNKKVQIFKKETQKQAKELGDQVISPLLANSLNRLQEK